MLFEFFTFHLLLVIDFLRKHFFSWYICIMKNERLFYIQKLIFELNKLAEKCVLLYFTMECFTISSYSVDTKNTMHCILLKFHCIFIVSSIVIHCNFKARFRCLKPFKKRVLLLIIMIGSNNSLKFRMFRNFINGYFIIKPLLFHFKSHYYSLLFYRDLKAG